MLLAEPIGVIKVKSVDLRIGAVALRSEIPAEHRRKQAITVAEMT